MHNKRFLIRLTIMTSIFLFAASVAAMAASVPRMTADELKMHLGDADYQILDVRAGGDWANSNVKITGAERVEPRAVGQWVDNYDKEKTIVLYCA
jgi:rhodanese-related sulfurtransferase